MYAKKLGGKNDVQHLFSGHFCPHLVKQCIQAAPQQYMGVPYLTCRRRLYKHFTMKMSPVQYIDVAQVPCMIGKDRTRATNN